MLSLPSQIITQLKNKDPAGAKPPSELRSNEPACRAAQRPAQRPIHNFYTILALLQTLLKPRIMTVLTVMRCFWTRLVLELGLVLVLEWEQARSKLSESLDVVEFHSFLNDRW